MTIYSLTEVMEMVEALPNKEDRFLILAFYEGLGSTWKTDILNICEATFENNVIVLPVTHRRLDISEKLVDYAKAFMATVPEEGLTTESINMRMKKIGELLGKKVQKSILRESGRIAMLNKYIMQNGYKDKWQALTDYRAELTHRYGPIVSEVWMRTYGEHVKKAC